MLIFTLLQLKGSPLYTNELLWKQKNLAEMHSSQTMRRCGWDRLVEFVLICWRNRLLPFVILKWNEQTSGRSSPQQMKCAGNQEKSIALSQSVFYWCYERLKQIKTAESTQKESWMILEIKQQRQKVCFPGNYLLITSTNDAQIVILTELEKHIIQGGWNWTRDGPRKTSPAWFNCSRSKSHSVDSSLMWRHEISWFTVFEDLCLYQSDKEQPRQECFSKLNTAASTIFTGSQEKNLDPTWFQREKSTRLFLLRILNTATMNSKRKAFLSFLLHFVFF